MDAHRLVGDELLYELRVCGLSELCMKPTEVFEVLVTHDSFEPELVVDTQTCKEKVTSEFLSERTAVVKGSNDERIVEARMKRLCDRAARVQKVIVASQTHNPFIARRRGHASQTANSGMQVGIAFSGKVSEMSINSFLERVEEYRVARGVSTQELLVSAGADESVGAYFACMINLFNRLPVQPSEAERLNILRRSLLPYFIHGIGLIDIETVSQLMAACKKLEVTKSLATASRAVNPKANLLEPDLADETSVRPKLGRKSVAAVSCWNCQHTGDVRETRRHEKSLLVSQKEKSFGKPRKKPLGRQVCLPRELRSVIGDPGWLKLRSLGLTLHPHQPVCVADGSVLAVSGSIDLPIEVSGRVRVSEVIFIAGTPRGQCALDHRRALPDFIDPL
ncbi:hypothetical protein GEV33_010817 [Tenebrio molitor]|uniref:Uncharacterized protein n=1 Tax=Tenebrio molitor TaxID=7067 RepID=A0A8J6L5T7_TENMO|nr:hypothetical protein GEV33_010817 [Tenebrio molitor]